MRKVSRARRHLNIVEPLRVIPDLIAGSSVRAELEADPRVRRQETGGFVAPRSVAIEYAQKLRGGNLTLCCARAPRCEHFTGGVL